MHAYKKMLSPAHVHIKISLLLNSFAQQSDTYVLGIVHVLTIEKHSETTM